MYEKIIGLISRNDFTTAEKLLEKHRDALTDAQKQELRERIAERRRKKEEDDRKLAGRRRFSMRWNRHCLSITRLKIVLACCLLVGLGLFVPYLKNKYYARPEPFVIHGIEVLFLIYLFLLASLLTLELIDAHIHKIDYRDMGRREDERAEPPSGGFRSLEKRTAEKEKKLLAGLACVILWILLQLWRVISLAG